MAADFNRALDEALKPKEKGKELGKEMAQGIEEELEPIKLSAAILKGSKEAYSLIVANQMRGLNVRDEPIKNVAKEVKKGNDLAKKGNKDLAKMREKFDEWGDF
jgi:hypothetical protein